MTIAVFLVTPGGMRARGGIGRVVAYLQRGCRGREAELRLTIIDSYGPDRKILMPVWFALAFFRLLLAALTGRIDVLHLNVAERGSVWRKGILVWLARIFRIPVVLHCHGAEFVEWCRNLSPSARRLLTATLARTQRVIVLGRYWRDFVSGELGVPGDKIEILHNAAPMPTGKRLRAGDDGVRILFLGRLGERKGVPELLRALADPRLATLRWIAVLAGDGAVERFRAETRALGLSDRIELTGWIDEAAARRQLATADMLVLPSHNEGLPMAVLEAMAHGLAVVTTPVGAIPDAIRDGETGLLVPARDPLRLADALHRLIVDPALRKGLGERAHARFADEFSIDAYTVRLMVIYRALASRQPSRLVRTA
jgi:glycosyltransferase involved in cell wall biosynthesis